MIYDIGNLGLGLARYKHVAEINRLMGS